MRFFCSLFSIFLSATFLYPQNPFEKESEEFANAVDAEKIYLQLSGTTFDTSETIWFKAIVTNVVEHKPTTKSAVLHVELIDPLNEHIVDSKLLKIKAGVAENFFQLHSNYREGKYIIRAYTEWNKNFETDFITSVPIAIYGIKSQEEERSPIQDLVFTKDFTKNKFSISSKVFPLVLDSLHKGNAMLYMSWKDGQDSISIKLRRKTNVTIEHNVPLDVQIINYQLKTQNKEFAKSIVLDDTSGTLQFFPEGGNMVEEMESSIGFKYLDYRGKGNRIQGFIEDNEGNRITKFESNFLGMGQFKLIPKPNKTYYGILSTKNGNVIKYKLPNPIANGVVLGLTHNYSFKEIQLRKKDKSSDSLFVKLYHRGSNLFLLKSKFKRGRFAYKIQNKDLPHGVIGLTVYDNNYRPVAERTFFNHLKEEQLNVTIETDRALYNHRDSVQVSITTKYNGSSVPASVSVMAIDSAHFYGTNLNRNTILSYFLLQSDIKGPIEDPSYYFENNGNLTELDYLMLTQGWTNYKYKAKKKPRLFKAEKGLEIKGTVNDVQRTSERDGPKKKEYVLNMLLMGEPMEAHTQETDSTGYFSFALNDSYGLGKKFVIRPSEVSIKSSNQKIAIKKYNVPKITYETEKIIVPVDRIIERKMIEKIGEDIKLDPFLLPNTIALNEVVVSDYQVTPERSEMVELHGIPDVVIDNKELLNKQKKWTRNLYRWLLFNYPKEIRVRRVGNGGGFEIAYVYGAGFTYIVIDGTPIRLEDYRLIGNIPVSAVKSAEIIRNSSTANDYHSRVFPCSPICPPPQFPAILAIYTYSGKGLAGAFPKSRSTNLINGIAPQFSPEREYYVPPYQDAEKIDWDIPDRRTLLYWKPNIPINDTGQANTVFFNSDIRGKMVLICEGITANGKIGYSELIYEVD